MPRTEVLILAMTKMLSGICTAGFVNDRDPVTGLRWVRPVREFGTLLPGDMTDADGHLVQCCDVVELNPIPVNEILTRMNLWLPGLGTSVFLSLQRDFVLPRAIFDEKDSQVVSKSEFTVQSVPKCRCTDTE